MIDTFLSSGHFPTVALKRAEPVAMTEALRAHIMSAYAEPPGSYQDDLRVLDTLRGACVQPTAHKSSLDKLTKYQGQLVFVMAKFPVNIGVAFAWTEAQNPEMDPSKRSSLAYERACVLYNLASVYACLGSDDALMNEQGIKQACMYFQTASAIFSWITSNLLSELQCDTTLDICSETLTMLAEVMLAQAQECFYLRAVMGSSKDVVLAKLALAVADQHQKALKAQSQLSVEHTRDKFWKSYSYTKEQYYRALAFRHVAHQKASIHEYGQQVALLDHARNYLATAVKEAQHLAMPYFSARLKECYDMIVEEFTAAEKDNDLIYLLPIPAENELTLPTAAMMASPQLPPEIAKPEEHLEKLGRQLFFDLAPAIVHEARLQYLKRRETLVETTIRRPLRELEKERESMQRKSDTASLLEALEHPIGLPASLLASARDVRAKGGITLLDRQMQQIDQLATVGQESLDQIYQMLNECRSQQDLYIALCHRAHTLSSKLNDAKKNDTLVREQLTAWHAKIKLLSSDQKQLEQAIPSYQAALGLDEHAQLEKLRKMMADLHELGRQAHDEQKRCETAMDADNIGPALLTLALHCINATPNRMLVLDDFEPCIEEHLKRYQVYTTTVNDLATRQQALLKEIQHTTQTFHEMCETSTGLHQRRMAHHDLITTYHHFLDIRKDISDRLKFYKDFSPLIEKLLKECAKICKQEDTIEQLVRKMQVAMTPGSNQPKKGWHPGMPLCYEE